MKTKLLIIFSTLVIVLGLSFISSCRKDDGNTLEGTTWIGLLGNELNTLSFQHLTFTCVVTEDGYVIEMWSGTYTYVDPIVTLYAQDGQEVQVVTGTRNGNTLYLGSGVLTKQ